MEHLAPFQGCFYTVGSCYMRPSHPRFHPNIVIGKIKTDSTNLWFTRTQTVKAYHIPWQQPSAHFGKDQEEQVLRKILFLHTDHPCYLQQRLQPIHYLLISKDSKARSFSKAGRDTKATEPKLQHQAHGLLITWYYSMPRAVLQSTVGYLWLSRAYDLPASTSCILYIRNVKLISYIEPNSIHRTCWGLEVMSRKWHRKWLPPSVFQMTPRISSFVLSLLFLPYLFLASFYDFQPFFHCLPPSLNLPRSLWFLEILGSKLSWDIGIALEAFKLGHAELCSYILKSFGRLSKELS